MSFTRLEAFNSLKNYELFNDDNLDMLSSLLENDQLDLVSFWIQKSNGDDMLDDVLVVELFNYPEALLECLCRGIVNITWIYNRFRLHLLYDDVISLLQLNYGDKDCNLLAKLVIKKSSVDGVKLFFDTYPHLIKRHLKLLTSHKTYGYEYILYCRSMGVNVDYPIKLVSNVTSYKLSREHSTMVYKRLWDTYIIHYERDELPTIIAKFYDSGKFCRPSTDQLSKWRLEDKQMSNRIEMCLNYCNRGIMRQKELTHKY